MVRHRWISQDGKACLLASWFLSRDVAVHSGVRRSISPGTSVLQVPQENAPGGPGSTTTADATVWQNPCSAAGGLYVVSERPLGVCIACWCSLSHHSRVMRAGAARGARTPPPRGARSTRAVKG